MMIGVAREMTDRRAGRDITPGCRDALVERHVEQHGVGQLASRELQHLRPLGRDDHAIAALREHALERLGQPLSELARRTSGSVVTGALC